MRLVDETGAIQLLENWYITTHSERGRAAIRLAIEALREKRERESVEALTLSDIEKMRGVAAYFVAQVEGGYWRRWNGWHVCNGLTNIGGLHLNIENGMQIDMSGYGREIVAYRRKPEWIKT